MKRIFLVAATLVTLQATAQKKDGKFTLQGDLSKISDTASWVYLSYSVDGENKKDSALPQKGKYSFSGQLNEPVLANIWISHPAGTDGKIKPPSYRRDMTGVYLQPGKLKAHSVDSFSNITLTGSKAHDEFTKLNEQAKAFDGRLKDLYKSYGEARTKKDQAEMDKIEAQIDAVNDEMKDKVYATYVKANPSSPMAVYALKTYAGWDIDVAKVEPLFNLLSEQSKNTFSGKSIGEMIDIAKKTAVGSYAMEFTQNDTLGKPVALSSFKGKYLLIDFWASWCGPCRAENPNVVKAFQRYKEKGFQILGVSLDRPGAQDKWVKAIHDDNLTWTHVSDLQYWKNAVALQYGIKAIPQNLLLDPQGKIIGKNLRGEDLEKKLAALLN